MDLKAMGYFPSSPAGVFFPREKIVDDGWTEEEPNTQRLRWFSASL